jgi:flagellin
MRTLALSSATGSLSADDRKSNNDEYQALTSELNRISATTTFGGQKLLDGSYGTKAIQVGANANETINLSLENVAASNIGSQQVKSTAIAPSASGLAAGSLSVTGNGQTATVAYAAGASAKQIASDLNGSIGGLTATASTELQLDVTGATPANFKLSVGSSGTVDFVGVTDTAGLADQLKSNAAKLGISVNYDEVKALSIKSDTGENISFSGADANAQANISIAAKDGSGNFAAGAALVLLPRWSPALFRWTRPKASRWAALLLCSVLQPLPRPRPPSRKPTSPTPPRLRTPWPLSTRPSVRSTASVRAWVLPRTV